MTDEETQKQLNIIKAHATRLLDAGFDTVQIFASKYSKEQGTHHWAWGDGDYMSRFGQVTIWMDRERASEWAKEIKND